MEKGKLIVIEGTDCSGKETQSKLLEEKLNALGYNVYRTGFPKYETPTGKIVGGCYLGKPEISESLFSEGANSVDPKVACLYYAADRKYNINEALEFLEKGYFVILDRYTTSNMAHQGGKILDKEERINMYQWIDRLEYWLLGLPKPDITIFLHMPYEQSLELKRNREFLDEHEKNPEHLKHAEASYIELSELYNWSTIKCVADGIIRTKEDIHNDVLKIVLKDYE